MGMEMISTLFQNTEAQRTQSFNPRIPSVISVPLCFQSSRPKIAEKLRRTSALVRKSRVCRTEGAGMSRLRKKNTEAQRTQSFNPRIYSVISVPLCFQSFRPKIAEKFAACVRARSQKSGLPYRRCSRMSRLRKKNTEAQRTQSFDPRISSVISVPLCFQSSRPKIAERFAACPRSSAGFAVPKVVERVG